MEPTIPFTIVLGQWLFFSLIGSYLKVRSQDCDSGAESSCPRNSAIKYQSEAGRMARLCVWYAWSCPMDGCTHGPTAKLTEQHGIFEVHLIAWLKRLQGWRHEWLGIPADTARESWQLPVSFLQVVRLYHKRHLFENKSDVSRMHAPAIIPLLTTSYTSAYMAYLLIDFKTGCNI